MEKPVAWSMEVKRMIQDVDSHLTDSINKNLLECIDSALATADGKPVCCRLLDDCIQAREKLESEIELGRATQVQTITTLDDFTDVHEALCNAIENAEYSRADPARVAWAKGLRRKHMAEASLLRAVQGFQKTTSGHIAMLVELEKAARAEGANDKLLNQATALISKLKSEQEVHRRIADSAPLCEVASYKDASLKENLPPWYHETEQFEGFHDDYKKVVETAERVEISPLLINQALGQLAALEQLLVEKKQVEAERGMKSSKGKKGKKT